MKVNDRYRQTFHACVPEMWSNDPNGFIFYNGVYHLFYQHYPHAVKWGPMHWGHFTTTDFVHWKDEPLALVPEYRYEKVCGCCSGSAFIHDGKLWIVYTAAQPDLQRQCYAWSEDGIHFTKDPENPVIVPDQLSPEISVKDFRDPHMFRKDDTWYIIAAARTLDLIGFGSLPYPTSGGREKPDAPLLPPGRRDTVLPDGYGNLVLLKSPDLRHWSYVGKLIYRDDRFPKTLFRLEGAYECPDYITLDGQELLIASPQNLPQNGLNYQNIHSNVYMPGTLDFESGRFDMRDIVEIDSGFDFYAPQCVKTPDGRTILTAWKEMWDRSFPTEIDLWAGSYTLPRELSFKDGHLYQTPVREIETFRANARFMENEDLPADIPLRKDGFSGNIYELDVEIDPKGAGEVGLKLFKGPEHATVLSYDVKHHLMTFDRTDGGIPITGRDNDVNVRKLEIRPEKTLRLRIFADVSTIEVFIDDGRYSMTGNVYPDTHADRGIEFFARGGDAVIRKAVFYDIKV